jgi:DNA primase
MESIHQDAAERIQKNVEDAARLVYLPDGVVELRAFGNERGFQKIYTGWFSDAEKFTAAALELERRECEVYATLNPTPKDLLARANNKLIAANAKVTPQTGNNDIERRRWILIDCDPKRVSKISATEAEKSAALERARLIRADLEEQGMRSILADSGNGAHVLVPVDLPNDADAAKLVENFLKALDFRYSDAAVEVDTTTANAARISKVYGTTARKGESVEEIGRVHRPSAILEAPEELEPVGADLLQAVADMRPQEPERTRKPRVGRPTPNGGEWDLERWIADYGVPIKKSGPWKDGGQKWILESCPWNGHEDDACYIVQQPTGEIGAGCQHNSCEGYGWRDLRAHFEPDAYERQSSARWADTTEDDPAGSSGGAKREGNQAQRLIGYAMADADELFLDQNGTEHALIAGVPVPLDRGCYGWLRRLFWEHEETAATTDLLGTVAGQLRAFAEVSGNERVLHLRAAQHEGAVYLYLGPGRVVRVDASGWDLDPNPPVMFRRVVNLKELPTPKRDGSLDLLDDFITAREDRDHRLAKAWLVLGLLADITARSC